MKISRQALKVLIVFLIIIDAIIFWYIFQPPADFKENVVVTNLNKIESDYKIPLNFPKNIFLEENITDSYVMEYLDRGVRISGVSYISQKNSDEIYEMYNQSLVKENYILNSKETQVNLGTMYFTKNKDSLNILINKHTPEENKTTVQLVYTQNLAD